MRAVSVRDLRHAAHLMRRGGVIAYPTESCFGLGCDPGARVAVRRLLRIKHRPQHKGLILIGDRPETVARYGEVPQRAVQSWPGPVTWLVPPTRHAHRGLRGAHERIALRVPAHARAAALSRMARDAIVSTSANHAGERPARSAREVRRRFGGAIVGVVHGRIGGRRLPSTIIDAPTGRVVRHG
ncbi:MAG: L-threonylcarbamoyladenylate synthase [Acidiferrobacteraceae bacterium]